MLNKISEARRLMLQAAAERKDRLLQPPANARGAVAKTVAGKLIDAGWAKEIKAPNGAPVWRKDAASGELYALKLTAKGLKAVEAENEGAVGAERSSVSATAEKAALKTPARRSARPARAQTAATAADDPRGAISGTVASAPRASSKLGRVLDMLSAGSGATTGELTRATGWLEHTTRAALTGLRRRGYDVILKRRERDGASVYRVAARSGEAAK